ncbi:MAG: methyl-accepting chemotaxis protein [Desulfobulbaceae bacterium]|nr:methyl-accepting chemotaxis protein [Desulfobulbaceae bacterium]HIJ77994.1 HAMP domain-containing protein [Deltaproteobacteria bacterium]
MLKNMKLGTKLLLAFLGVGIIPFAIIGLTSLTKASAALSQGAFNQLTGVQAIKQAQIKQFFVERKGDMGVLMETVGTLRSEAFAKLRAIQENKKVSFKEYVDGIRGKLILLRDDPYAVNALAQISGAGKVDSGQWQAIVKKYDSRLKEINLQYGWYDLFLINPDGTIVYSAEKESDLGMNIPNSVLRDSAMGKAFQYAKNMSGDEIAIGDIAPYAPSGGDPAGFMMAQMRDGNGKLNGYVAMQMPIAQINLIMGERKGLGKTGETYVVGQDLLMRSDSFLAPESHSVKASFRNNNKADTEAVRSALAGNSGAKVIEDYNGNDVLSAWDTIELGSGVKWALLTEIDVAEAFSPVDESGTAFYEKYVKLYGYYDLFLIAPDGHCFYTVAKEADYNTNFVNGKYASSNLGSLVKKVLQTKQYGMADFAPYAASNNEPCSFIAQPVVSKDGVEMVVALQVSLGAINKIMQQRDGMGQSGESYLVGPDKLMRSDSFLDPTNHSVKASFANPSVGSVDTEAAREALSGRAGARIIQDYNDNPVLSVFAPLDLGGLTWAVIAEIDESEAFAAVHTLKWIMGVIFVIGLGAIIGVAMIITRSITQPVNKTVHMLQEMEKGHLDSRLNMDRGDEIGIMAKTMDSFADNLQNEMVHALQKLAAGDLTFEANPRDEDDAIRNSLKKTGDDLNKIISDILVATEQIASGSGQVSDASQALSQGATEQAASLEEITSSMTQMASQTTTNAENATQANQLATQTRDAAEKGNGQMQQMVSAMGEINEAGQNISKIIKVIDEIAFQTNLLALNAAVEAARAGRHGKGFAVVAEEVRNLAARSAKAAKETAELIEGSVAKTENGTKIAEATSEALSEIVASVTKVTDLVGEIAAASNEQAQGISQTNQALGQIDQVTQQNTASAEESAAAAEELSSQAVHMKDMMSNFKVRQLGYSNRPQPALSQHAKPAPAKDVYWGETPIAEQKTAKKPTSKPSDVIALDDAEFGKY